MARARLVFFSMPFDVKDVAGKPYDFEDDKQHFGAIGENQLALAREAVAEVDPSWVRIAVLHHHVLPLRRELDFAQRSNNNQFGS